MRTERPVHEPKPIRLRWFALIVCVAGLAAGCASVQEAAPEQKAEALRFTPPPGRAGLYVIRESSFSGARVLFRVGIDGREFGVLPGGTYIYGTIPAGPHALEPAIYEGGTPAEHDAGRTFGAGAKSALFSAEAGGNYFFIVKGDWVGLEIERIPDAEGQKDARKMKLSGR